MNNLLNDVIEVIASAQVEAPERVGNMRVPQVRTLEGAARKANRDLLTCDTCGALSHLVVGMCKPCRVKYLPEDL